MERKLTTDDQSWLTRLAQSATQIASVLTHVQRIAVIGIKPDAVGGPAFYVPAYAQAAGLDIVPVPVYYPDVTFILGAPVHRSLTTVIPPADTVLLFRRSAHLQRHLDEIRSVWTFVNNHFEGFAPETCLRLAERLGYQLPLPGTAKISQPRSMVRPVRLSCSIPACSAACGISRRLQRRLMQRVPC